jgi:hypothetical protein
VAAAAGAAAAAAAVVAAAAANDATRASGVASVSANDAYWHRDLLECATEDDRHFVDNSDTDDEQAPPVAFFAPADLTGYLEVRATGAGCHETWQRCWCELRGCMIELFQKRRRDSVEHKHTHARAGLICLTDTVVMSCGDDTLQHTCSITAEVALDGFQAPGSASHQWHLAAPDAGTLLAWKKAITTAALAPVSLPEGCSIVQCMVDLQLSSHAEHQDRNASQTTRREIPQAPRLPAEREVRRQFARLVAQQQQEEEEEEEEEKKKEEEEEDEEGDNRVEDDRLQSMPRLVLAHDLLMAMIEQARLEVADFERITVRPIAAFCESDWHAQQPEIRRMPLGFSLIAVGAAPLMRLVVCDCQPRGSVERNRGRGQAASLGICDGDVLVEVDGQSTRGMPLALAQEVLVARIGAAGKRATMRASRRLRLARNSEVASQRSGAVAVLARAGLRLSFLRGCAKGRVGRFGEHGYRGHGDTSQAQLPASHRKASWLYKAEASSLVGRAASAGSASAAKAHATAAALNISAAQLGTLERMYAATQGGAEGSEDHPRRPQARESNGSSESSESDSDDTRAARAPQCSSGAPRQSDQSQQRGSPRSLRGTHGSEWLDEEMADHLATPILLAQLRLVEQRLASPGGARTARGMGTARAAEFTPAQDDAQGSSSCDEDEVDDAVSPLHDFASDQSRKVKARNARIRARQQLRVQELQRNKPQEPQQELQRTPMMLPAQTSLQLRALGRPSPKTASLEFTGEQVGCIEAWFYSRLACFVFHQLTCPPRCRLPASRQAAPSANTPLSLDESCKPPAAAISTIGPRHAPQRKSSGSRAPRKRSEVHACRPATPQHTACPKHRAIPVDCQLLLGIISEQRF